MGSAEHGRFAAVFEGQGLLAMAYWLMKSEPEAFSWADLEKAGFTWWDGVRNYTARNNLRAMKVGDEALFYQSNAGVETGVVGIVKVEASAKPDPTFKPEKGKNNPWVVVKVVPVKKFGRVVTLAELRGVKALAEMALFKQSRLSVQPVSAAEWKVFLKLGA
jgi:predicted RNA-binding protein with PUA-like domain